MIFVSLALLFLIFVVASSVAVQYRRSTRQYKALARSLCDPGSWRVTFLLRMVVLRGTVDGFPICYSVLGTPQGEEYATSYLLLLCPVKRNLRVYGESDLSLVDDAIRPEIEVFGQTEGFRALIFTPARSPFLGKLLSRPLGFPYGPGILLWRLGSAAFDPETIRADLALLVALSRKDAW